ncbi:class I SAM-dependent methyltransferase [Chryseobacterium sp. Leaf405]|uniref:class I SAM-dependent methyltransferase n=1 Tax=Chryseobacterium sp. Leaf405 TaxID=1736367 RepID=UPI000AB4B02B|nr:methyltransferase domain-containing protein [Chryseobacterium sp. Leaf405]
MKITKLVILFNHHKILLGIVVSAILLLVSFYIHIDWFQLLLRILSTLIVLNIIASIIASYILYDNSDLYELNSLKGIIDWEKTKNVILVHASFDPLSTELKKKYPDLNLTVCDIFGNRHEKEKGIETSKKVFPPNPKEIKISPNKLPLEDQSQDVILGITALHEILDHNQRVLFFKEAKRILKDEGVIIVSEQFRDFTNFVFFNIGAFHFLSQRKWKKAISEAGLKIIENNKITFFANMLVVKK